MAQEQAPPRRSAVGVRNQHRIYRTRLSVGDGVPHCFEPVQARMQRAGASEDAQARPAGLVGGRPVLRTWSPAGGGEQCGQGIQVRATVRADVVWPEHWQQARRIGTAGGCCDLQQRLEERPDVRRARMPRCAQRTAVGVTVPSASDGPPYCPQKPHARGE